MLPFDYLADFVVVANCGSFSRAAIQLGTSQPSLSRHIKSLEAQLGVALLRRTNSGVELTAEGQYVADRANDMLDIAEDILVRISPVKNIEAFPVYGAISFAEVMHAIELALAGECGQRKAAELPDETLENISAPEMLVSGMARLVVDFSNSSLFPAQDSRFVRVPLMDVPHIARVEPGHPLANKSVVTVKDLDGAVVLYSTSCRNCAGAYWESLRYSLRSMGVRFSSKGGPLKEDINWINNMTQGICVIPGNFNLIKFMREHGKQIIPVQGIAQQFEAVHLAEDDLAHDVALRAREILAKG